MPTHVLPRRAPASPVLWATAAGLPPMARRGCNRDCRVLCRRAGRPTRDRGSGLRPRAQLARRRVHRCALPPPACPCCPLPQAERAADAQTPPRTCGTPGAGENSARCHCRRRPGHLALSSRSAACHRSGCWPAARTTQRSNCGTCTPRSRSVSAMPRCRESVLRAAAALFSLSAAQPPEPVQPTLGGLHSEGCTQRDRDQQSPPALLTGWVGAPRSECCAATPTG